MATTIKSYNVTNAVDFSADIKLRIINNNPYIETNDVPDGYSLWVIKNDLGDSNLYKGSNTQDGIEICKVDLSNTTTIEDKLSAIKGQIFFAKGLAKDFSNSLTVTTADGKSAVVQSSNIVLFSV